MANHLEDILNSIKKNRLAIQTVSLIADGIKFEITQGPISILSVQYKQEELNKFLSEVSDRHKSGVILPVLLKQILSSARLIQVRSSNDIHVRIWIVDRSGKTVTKASIDKRFSIKQVSEFFAQCQYMLERL